MAADAYLLSLAEADTGPPVVRIYGWDRPSITIGYHQRPGRAVDLNRLGETPIARRITGGRALYHDTGEVTYAVAGNFMRYPVLGSDLHGSYNIIARAIVEFYRSHGWPAEISHRDHPISLDESKSVQKGCFAAVSRYEIVVSGQKVAAGSQRRTKTSFLQHGAIKLAPPESHPAIIDIPEPVAGKDLGKIEGDFGELAENIIIILSKIYNVGFDRQPFSPRERTEIEGLMAAARLDNLH